MVAALFGNADAGDLGAPGCVPAGPCAARLTFTQKPGVPEPTLKPWCDSGIIEGIDTAPLLTAIGLHVPLLLQAHEEREMARKWAYVPINYHVDLDERVIFHARTAASFRIEADGTLTVLSDTFVSPDEREDAIAGAREALRQHRERDPRVVGKFVWVG